MTAEPRGLTVAEQIAWHRGYVAACRDVRKMIEAKRRA